MSITITMPALSPTMTEGGIAKWHKKEGDQVKSGDVIAEVETDKATVEVEAADDGVLGKILQPAGAKNVKVNEPIAILLEEGEDASKAKATPAPKPAPQQEAKAQPEAKPAPAPAQAAPKPQAQAPAAQPASSGNGADRVFVSPLARRMAEQAGVDLHGVKGSGPHGRIVKSDIDAALSRGPRQAPPAQPGAPVSAPPAARGAPQIVPGIPPFTEVPHSSMRRVIAKRLAEAKREAPHFYVAMDCEVDKLLALRKELNERAPKDGPGAYKLSVNDFVIRALALALRKVPAANAAWTENAIRLYEGVDVSVAVAIPNGLITPVIRSAHVKGLAEISNEMRVLAEKARTGKLLPEEYQGGTVSLSNLGMYGVKHFSAVLNPPQGCILAVGAAEQRPVVRDGALAIATVMTCTVSCDHRSVDGAVGAEFLAAFKKLVEDPVTMLL
jgi:pyruvate dehydrogenase E2 component (dihydrolipoamide acetyltransferase)